jgi:hypothetical protein
MSHFRTHLLNTPEQAVRLLDLADHPNLLVLLDTYHMVTEVRDFAAAIDRVGDRLWGLHACENDRGAPGGGLVPWPAVVRALVRTPARRVLFESYNSSLGDFAVCRGMFHDVCPDGDDFVRRGMQFLQPLIKAACVVRRFAVLRHEGVESPHFDLLIETAPGGALAAWRCEDWPIDRPASLVRLPDHRSIYLDYEGPVSGNRGTVRRVAGGECRVSVGAEGWMVDLHAVPPVQLRLVPAEGDRWRAEPLSPK